MRSIAHKDASRGNKRNGSAESIMTPVGKDLLQNFLDRVGRMKVGE